MCAQSVAPIIIKISIILIDVFKEIIKFDQCKQGFMAYEYNLDRYGVLKYIFIYYNSHPPPPPPTSLLQHEETSKLRYVTVGHFSEYCFYRNQLARISVLSSSKVLNCKLNEGPINFPFQRRNWSPIGRCGSSEQASLDEKGKRSDFSWNNSWLLAPGSHSKAAAGACLSRLDIGEMTRSHFELFIPSSADQPTAPLPNYCRSQKEIN